MKHTDFQFELRLDSDPLETLNGLEAKLQAIKGIDSVNTNKKDCIAMLTLNAIFEDAAQAKRIHRRVVNTLMNYEGITVLQAKTVLTDIF